MAKKNECNVEGCTQAARKRGVCAKHSEENYVLGCTVDECPNELFAKGCCKVHYMRRYRRKRGEAAPDAKAPIRPYGQERFEVFTRIPAEAARVILKAAGRKNGMYEKAQEILTTWATRYQQREASKG